MAVCENCGGAFIKKRVQQKYCCSKCGKRARNRKYEREARARGGHTRQLFLRQCDQCLGWFLTHQPWQLGCSEHCRWARKSKQEASYRAQQRDAKKLAAPNLATTLPEGAHYWVPENIPAAAEGLVTPAL